MNQITIFHCKTVQNCALHSFCQIWSNFPPLPGGWNIIDEKQQKFLWYSVKLCIRHNRMWFSVMAQPLRNNTFDYVTTVEHFLLSGNTKQRINTQFSEILLWWFWNTDVTSQQIWKRNTQEIRMCKPVGCFCDGTSNYNWENLQVIWQELSPAMVSQWTILGLILSQSATYLNLKTESNSCHI